jgi:non-ribosomal peptide synthetase component F
VVSESIVGICIDRSSRMAVAIIATLKAGAAYLPLDPEYPQERIAFMLEDAQPALVRRKRNLPKSLFVSEGEGCAECLDARPGFG